MNDGPLQDFAQSLRREQPLPAALRPKPSGAVPLNDYLRIEEVSERLGISHSAIYDRIKSGYLHPVRKHGGKGKGSAKRIYFNPHEVQNEIDRADVMREAKLGSYHHTNRLPKPKHEKPGEAEKTAATKEEKKIEPARETATEAKEKTRGKGAQPPFTGEQCAQSVSLFRQGKNQLDVVVEMKVTFEIARYFWECFQAAQPAWSLPPKDFAQIRLLLSWEEEIPTPEGMRKALAAHIASQVEREVKAAVNKHLGGEELTAEERAALAEVEKEETKGKERPGSVPEKSAETRTP